MKRNLTFEVLFAEKLHAVGSKAVPRLALGCERPGEDAVLYLFRYEPFVPDLKNNVLVYDHGC